MKILGEKIFARDAEGNLVSRIGTLFLRTPGLVTMRGVHAMQRQMWIDELNRERAAEGEAPLSRAEADEEFQESVDLVFTDDHVLIRPDPERMDLAFKADEILQEMVSKRVIRFLNTSSAKVRSAITMRGENWRISRHPISQEDIAKLIEHSKVPICENPIYYYNRATGTRYVTASTYLDVQQLDNVRFRRQIKEFVDGISKRNRMGNPEVDLFPLSTPIEIKKAWKTLPVAELTDEELRARCEKIDQDWRMSLPPELRDESITNYDWRNEMCQTITRQPNETSSEEQKLISGIASEFYRQIEWLPGAMIDHGEVIFDPIYSEADRTRDPKLLAICDPRVKAIIFNLTRMLGDLDFINVGKIVNTLSRDSSKQKGRNSIYILQYKFCDESKPRVLIMRLQKWGIAERLDQGKNMLQAILETDEYADYILDRRRMCLQLGMHLPKRMAHGSFTEKYHGMNQYNGVTVRTSFFMRPYIPGYASDKIPQQRYRNPVFALRFAAVMGRAAAMDMIVGRRATETKELLFDRNYEVILMDQDGMPEDWMITDHAGTFVNYEHRLEDFVAQYATAVQRRKEWVPDYHAFVDAYVNAFGDAIAEAQLAYRTHRRAYDNLFVDRPFDVNGSGAYRWVCVLKRLDEADPDNIAAILRTAIGN